MPIYEYFCPKCEFRFELLRPLSCAEQGAACPHCQGEAQRVLSKFASLSKGEEATFSTSSCSGCTATSCDSCH